MSQETIKFNEIRIHSTTRYYGMICTSILKLNSQQNGKEIIPIVDGIDVNNSDHNVTINYMLPESTEVEVKYNGYSILCKVNRVTDYISASYKIIALFELILKCENKNALDEFIKTSCVNRLAIPWKLQYNKANGEWEKVSNLERMMWENYIMGEKRKNNIIEMINKFTNSEDEYAKHGKPYKLVIMLSGPPGTGKTSLSKLIGNLTNRHIYNFAFDVSTTDSDFLAMYGSIQNKSIILFEDLDRVFSKEGNKTAVTLSTLLNAFDGATSKHGSIIIITANNTHLFEPALIRKGRVDKIIRFKTLNVKKCNRAFEIYECNDMIPKAKESIIEQCTTNGVTSCVLTDFLFMNSTAIKSNLTVDWGKKFREYLNEIKKDTEESQKTIKGFYT